ncbi:MAG: hypothetical protein QNJ46_24340 [Leptolyngbyaceae cyanobacterium MO_188.B28]|nr:hypothetical protein [Leptolyngbyaceae cyanobacterium MO_188.B28]
MKTVDISGYPVMLKQLSTCPFRTDERGRHPDSVLAAKIQQRCLTQASQNCHHPSLSGQPETHLCRGARDFQLQIFYRLGLLTDPTDEVWKKARTRLALLFA